MEERILESTKQKLGIKDPSNDRFDVELIDYINAALSNCWQIGIGPKTGFELKTGDEKWSDFLGENYDPRYNLVKNYVFLHVKFIFDTPIGTVNSKLTDLYNEYEWRLSILKEEIDNE